MNRREHPRTEEVRCERCGAPGDAGQRYCLHCGARMPGTGGGRMFLRTRREWLTAALALALAAALGIGLALAARAARNSSQPTLLPGTLAPPTTPTIASIPTSPATTALPSPPSITVTTGTLPAAPGAPSTAATTTAPPPQPRRSHGILSWPAGRRGYTVILVSIAESAGRAAASRQAREASRRGIDRVGVLLSSDHSSLHAGYWVVFAGVYGSETAAQNALPAAHAAGFPGAYPALVAP